MHPLYAVVVGALAHAHREEIRSWFNRLTLVYIDAANRRAWAEGKDWADASDDISDANQAMVNAWETVIPWEFDAGDESDCDLCNRAWDAAKRFGYQDGGVL